MPETTTLPIQNIENSLFQNIDAHTVSWESSMPVWLPTVNISQSEKDAIMRQIHPIFLTAHSEEKTPIKQENFDKFLGFLRLCLEWFLKLIDILVDASIQIARLFVWVIAIMWVLIVVTLMTNTTDKFIDILNSSIFPIIGLETKIQKVTPVTPPVTTSNKNNLESSTVLENTQKSQNSEKAATLTSIADAAETARQELINARRARFNTQ
jgi:hypothetical protein